MNEQVMMILCKTCNVIPSTKIKLVFEFCRKTKHCCEKVKIKCLLFLCTLYFIRKSFFSFFFLFAYLQSYIHKSFTNCPVKPQHVLYANQPFSRKMIVSFFSSNIPLYVEKNPVEKPCKVLEMELKTYTPFSLKFVFEKIKFKVLHYIQHDFISQRLGFSKD